VSHFVGFLRVFGGHRHVPWRKTGSTQTSRSAKSITFAEGYEERGVLEKEAERRAWATVNKDDRGGKKPGASGGGKASSHPAARKGGRLGTAAASRRSAAERSASAKKAAITRKRNAEHRAHGQRTGTNGSDGRCSLLSVVPSA